MRNDDTPIGSPPQDRLPRDRQAGPGGWLADRLRRAFHRPSGSFTSIREVVADVEGYERFAWILRNTLVFSLVAHAGFLTLFLVLHLWWLAALDAGSVAAYVAAIRLARRGAPLAPFRIAAVELVVHAVLATLALGMESGFFVYVPILTMLTLWSPMAGRARRVLWASVETLIFIVLVGTTVNMTAWIPLADGTLRTMVVMNVALFVTGLSFLAYVSNETMRTTEVDLRRALARLDDLARTDTLTGLLNRRAMSECLEAEAARVERHGRPFSVLVADLDDFKAINDAHGHPEGDHALRSIAQRLLGAVRAQDRVARWGGEEFLVLLPETDLETALKVGERLRVAVSEPDLELDGRKLRATATFGVATHEHHGSVLETIRRADRALYNGKRLGKDRVVEGQAQPAAGTGVRDS